MNIKIFYEASLYKTEQFPSLSLEGLSITGNQQLKQEISNSIALKARLDDRYIY